MPWKHSEEQRARLIQAYRDRLHLNHDTQQEDDTTSGHDDANDSSSLPPTLDTLRLLAERHLQYIPFENLSLHMKPPSLKTGKKQPPPVVLSMDELIDKLLVHRRGGCCLELNGLFCLLLDALGYTTRLVPCWVFAGQERGHASKKPKFRTRQSHFVILVQIPDNNCRRYMVDVGLGEPPLGPLEYGTDAITQEQDTSDGMKSRIVWDPRGAWVDGKGKERKCVLLEWWLGEAKGWEPRLQWDVNDAPLVCLDNGASATATEGPTLESFRYVIDILTSKKSSFACKVIVSRLTRTQKITLSGRTLKVTSPRFGADRRQVCTDLCSPSEVAAVLKEHFGIVLCGDTQELCFAASEESANTKLWDHL